MKALIIGATGATGRDLVQVLLQSDRYTSVTAFVRKGTGKSHAKLVEVITDFDHLESVAPHIVGDVWFCCIGTTIKTAGTKERQKHVDYEIPVAFAQIAKRNGIRSAVLLSSYGARIDSGVFFARLKGQLESDIEKLGFSQYIVFRPGLLLRDNTDRFGERISAGVLQALNAIGLMRKFRPLPTKTLAEKLANAPESFNDGKHVVELDQIF